MVKLTKSPLFSLALIATYLFLTGTPVLSSPSKRITFEKKTREETKYNINFKYKVREGNTIYSILKYFQPEKQDLSDLINRVKELNPQIEDITKIYPGQEIKLPQKIKNNSPNATSFKNKYHRLAGNYKTKEYTVKSGDYIVKILKEKADLPQELIFDEYLELFKQLNPDISNIQKLEVGQEITLPTPAERDRQQAMKLSNASSTPANDKTGKEKVSDNEPRDFPSPDIQNPNKYLFLVMLKKMGFKFSRNKKIFLPYNSTKWRTLDSGTNPLAISPWGEKYLFLSETDLSREQISGVKKEELTICRTEDYQDLEKLFEDMEKKSNRKFIFWNRESTLIINQNKHVLEIQGDYVFVLNMSSKSYFLFTRNEDPGSKLSSILSGFLARQNITLYCIQDKKGTTVLNTDYPMPEELYVPVKTRSQVLSEIHKDKYETRIEMGEGIDSEPNFLELLEKKGLAQGKNLRLQCFKHSKNKIVLSLPVSKLQKTENNLLLLPPSHRENTYLLALLNLHGYPAYVLSR